MRHLPLLSAIALLVPLTGCAARGGGGITNVTPVPLSEGANLVPHLAPDGRQGLVVEGRQSGAPAPLIITMLPRAEGERGWDVVEVEAADGARLPTLDARGRAVVFARAKVGGIPATLLLVASPDPGDDARSGTPRRMLIQTLRLEADETSARFRPFRTETTRGRYCSSTDALAATYRLALPADGWNTGRCDHPGA